MDAAFALLASYVAAALWALGATVALSLVVALAVMGVIAATKPAASTRHALWFVALIVPAVAPLVIVAAMAARGLGADATLPAAAPSVNAHVATASTARAGGATAPTAARTTLALPALNVPGVPGVPDVPQNIALAIAAAWLAGAFIGLAGLVRSVVRVRGLKVRSSPLEGALADDLPWLTQRGGREIYLRLSYELETPIAVGFRRPVILIPTDMATAAGLGSIESLVMHEYAHLTRYDDWTNFVQRAIERVFWFNPIVWAVGRRIALEREVAADEAVVEQTHDATNYASLLWRLAREMRMPEHVVVAPGALLTRKQISVRIERLLDGNARPRLGVAAFSLAAIAATGVAAVAASAPALVVPCATTAAVAPFVLPTFPPYPAVAAAPAYTAVNARAVPHPAAAPHPAPAARRATEQVADDDVHIPALDVHVPPVDVNVVPINVHVPEIDVHVPAMTVPVPPRTPPVAMHGTLSGDLTREIVKNCPACDFSKTNLKDVDLHGRTFTGTNFANANFSNANLSGARFNGVNFNNANFSGADLRNARIAGSEMDNANFGDADTTGMHVIASSLRNANIGEDAAGAFIASCSGCNLQGINLHGQDLSGIHLDGANLQGADLGEASLHGAVLTGVNLSGASLTNVDLSGASLRGVTLDGVDLTGADLSGTNFTGSSLLHVRGADIQPSTILGDGQAGGAHR